MNSERMDGGEYDNHRKDESITAGDVMKEKGIL